MTTPSQAKEQVKELHRGSPYRESDGRFRTTILTADNETYAVAYADASEGSSYRAQKIIDALRDVSRLKSENESLKARAGEWVRVADRLPERSGFYLTFDTYSESLPIKLNQWNSAYWFQNHSTITHWRELPQPPTNSAKE